MLLSGCREETSTILQPDLTFEISGISFTGRNSRVTPQTGFQENDKILFHAQGGITTDPSILTYQNQEWKPESDLQWNTNKEAASIQAYYPATPEGSLSLYPDGSKLIDLLGCQTTIPYDSPIKLLLEHQFAQLSIHVAPALNIDLKSLDITPSVSIQHINPVTGAPVFTANQTYTTRLTHNAQACYTLIIPPSDNMSILINLATADKSHDLLLAERNYQKGHAYECTIRPFQNPAGIYDAEDFIAFTHLINGIPYENRSLDEFADISGTNTVYNLYNDICFTPEDCEKIHEIGYYQEFKNLQFNDCFNGNGFTLSNLKLQAPQNTYGYGLFSYIGTAGVIKDLTIKDSELITSQYKVSVTGLLSGANYGLIDGCQLINCSLRADYPVSLRVGGITGSNKGTIVNTSVTYTSIINTSGQEEASSGGICSYNSGTIQNCYTAYNTFSQLAGGLTFTCENGSTMSNCYTHRNNPSSKFGNISHRARTSNIKYCYYDDPTEAPVRSSDYTYPFIFHYDPNTLITSQSYLLTDRLNLWTNVNTPALPSYSYRPWITAEKPPIILDRP